MSEPGTLEPVESSPMHADASSGGARRAAREPASPACDTCARFTDDPLELERVFVGITALSSAFGSTRGRAGICDVSGRFHDPAPACRDYLPRREEEPA